MPILTDWGRSGAALDWAESGGWDGVGWGDVAFGVACGAACDPNTRVERANGLRKGCASFPPPMRLRSPYAHMVIRFVRSVLDWFSPADPSFTKIGKGGVSGQAIASSGISAYEF